MAEDDQTVSLAGPFKLVSKRLGMLPIVEHFLGRIGLRVLLQRNLKASDERVLLDRASVSARPA